MFPTSNGPVEIGLVASLARPGGNVTGLSLMAPQLEAKRLELLTQTVPGLARVGVHQHGGGLRALPAGRPGGPEPTGQEFQLRSAAPPDALNW